MKTKTLMTILVGFLVISVVAGTTSIAASDKAKGKPEAPGERAKAPDLEKIEFIHYKKDSGKAKPPCDKDGVCDPGEKPSCPDCKNGDEDPTDPTTTCYAFMGKYGKKYLQWRNLPVEYEINPTGGPADLGFVGAAISAGAEAWDEETGSELFDLVGLNYTAGYNVSDYTNAIVFDDYYLDPDIIGACMVWYNPATKAIVEFDIVFETDYNWGDADLSGAEPDDPDAVMDLWNIATHELGHAVGLADIYDEACSDVTMYGYSGNEETKKRDLEEPDITGIQKLYGP